MKSDNYALLTNIFGILPQETKDLEGTAVSVVGIKIDANFFMVKLPHDKLHRTCELSSATLNKQSMRLLEAKKLNCFLSFCDKESVLRLGIYATHLRFCGQISLWPLRFLSKNSFAGSWWSILVKRSTIKIQQCFAPWQPKTRNLPVVHGCIDDWPKRFLLQKTVGLLDRCHDWRIHSFCYQEKILQKWLSAAHKRRINDLCLSFISCCTTTVTNKYQYLRIVGNTVEISATCKKIDDSKVIVSSNSTTTFCRLWSQRLQGLSNQLLRQIILIEAVNNILVESKLLDLKANGLTNPLSQFNEK